MINTIIIVLVVVFAVSLFLLYLPKLIKFIKNSKAKSKNAKKKKGKGKKKGDDKLKASKAVQEIRPVVKPANKEKAEKESKDIEAKRQGKALPNAEKPQQLDFKYSATKKSSIEDEEELLDDTENLYTAKESLEKLKLCIDLGNWEKAEEFAGVVKNMLPDNMPELRKLAFRMELIVRKEDLNKSGELADQFETELLAVLDGR